MTIDEAMKLLVEQYKKDKENEYIRDPVAHALYEVWKEADRQADERLRRGSHGTD